MNQTEELNYMSQFVPFKQIIKVSKVADGRKTDWFKGYLVGVTSRGLLLNPISEYGESIDPLASSFIAFPQYRNFNVSFEISSTISDEISNEMR